MLIEESKSSLARPIYFLPFDVQLQNTFCIEIVARRYPVEIKTMPHMHVDLQDVQVDSKELQAQVTLHLQSICEDTPVPFDLSFKLLGIFSYSENYREEDVRVFLEQGCLSILLPFARELLLSTCSRLQIPPIMLTMVRLAPHPSLHKSSPEENLDN